ncbi:phytanoyl-CoA dioxygenase family protein [Emticicia sp. 21SJ11W-3]|uniref:phytanoyl-CoA dioxygenase family protein n=1 Tax=Emticicia sp. 21SJ11W-3 TaxID=2916755 RepID=UPI00209FC049|nr:phytanoyl-CoA dioxygenase family protein [Emticicia sp. 21SJ11W-3]UTA70189.1 phytanoyl-CoA dioxygenase family protein [Emticicia sp. 21SJ11W-3]
MSQLKELAKKIYYRINGPRDFDTETLPWIDRENADISEFLKTHQQRADLPYNLEEKLNFWKENGYVVLEQVIPHELIDLYWSDVMELINNPSKFKTYVQIDRDEFKPKLMRHAYEWTTGQILGKMVKINDFHNQSLAAKKLFLYKDIISFLEAIFNSPVVGMQSLSFLYGSQQPTHADYPWVTAKIPSNLAAAWIPVEDVHINSGPLYYFAGSHKKVKKFNFGNGIFYSGQYSTKTPLDYARYLDDQCKELNLEKQTLLIKKGDVLIWHSALVHGGSIINDPNQTRKSFVCHYSSAQALPYHREAPGVEPKKFKLNNGTVYEDPRIPEQENLLKERGESFKG